MQISAGYHDPFTVSWPRLEYVLKGIKRPTGANKKSLQRLPITPQILRRIRNIWSQQPRDRDIIMLWAAFCLGFFGFLRAGEFTLLNDKAFDPEAHLTAGDIAIDSHTAPTLMRVTIKMSKTDPFRHGAHLFIGATLDDLCPVTAMLVYLACRGSSPGFLFKFADGRPLTRQRMVDKLRSALTSAGIDCRRFSGHSFRIGAATTAAAKGIQDATIKMLGRWESTAYQRYIQTPPEELSAMSAILSSEHGS